jgi:hypothetical protein
LRVANFIAKIVLDFHIAPTVTDLLATKTTEKCYELKVDLEPIFHDKIPKIFKEL